MQVEKNIFISHRIRDTNKICIIFFFIKEIKIDYLIRVRYNFCYLVNVVLTLVTQLGLCLQNVPGNKHKINVFFYFYLLKSL